jgi:hypothetical protein
VLAKVPRPRVTVKFTGLPETGFPCLFVTRAASGAASGEPATPTWLLPALIASAAGSELLPLFVPLSEPQAAAAKSARAEAAMSGRVARKLFTVRPGEKGTARSILGRRAIARLARSLMIESTVQKTCRNSVFDRVARAL